MLRAGKICARLIATPISMICGNTEMPCSECQIIVSKVTVAELRHQEQFPATNPNFELTDTDKQNILINVKKHYPNSKLSDYEILDLININSVGIMVEQIEQLH